MAKSGIIWRLILFPIFFCVTFIAGIHFIAVGNDGIARVLWWPINGFAVFIAVLEISWDLWELVFERIGTEDPSPSDRTERTLQPNITISTDFKIATLVVLTFFAISGVGYAIVAYVIPVSFVQDVIQQSVNWYSSNVLPYWESLNLPGLT